MSEALKQDRDSAAPAQDKTAFAGQEPYGNVYSLRGAPSGQTPAIQKRILERFNGDIAKAAIDGLASTRPQESAKRLLTPQQIVLFAVLVFGLAIALWRWPLAAFVSFNVFVTVYFISAIFFRLWLLIIGRKEKVEAPCPQPMADAQLPVVTILLPLYRDAAALPTLARAVDRLDYPAHKKDVKLLLEEDDPETIAEAQKLGLNTRYETIIIPPQAPRTKPKACNYGLYLARGGLIVIYDAEDLPEPDQLKKAAARFAEGDAKLACVQARLNYYNREDNWLTRGIMAQTPLAI